MAATVAERARDAKKPDAPDYPGCAVYTLGDEKAGVLKERFVSAEDGIEYLHVKTGLLGLRSFLVPARAVAEDGERRVLVFRQELERASRMRTPNPERSGGGPTRHPLATMGAAIRRGCRAAGHARHRAVRGLEFEAPAKSSLGREKRGS